MTALLILGATLVTTATDAAPGEPVAASVEAAAPAISVSAQTEIASTYVFRGIPQYADKTTPSSQTSVGVSVDDLVPGSLSLSVWNATAVNQARRHGDPRVEVDLSAGYSLAVIDGLELGVGYIGYLYPTAETVDGAHEIAVSVAAESGWVRPFLEVYAEVVRLRGVYAAAGVDRELEIDAITITPRLSAAVAAYEAVPFTFNDVTASVAAQWAFAEPFYLSFLASYSYAGVGARDLASRSVSVVSVGVGAEL